MAQALLHLSRGAGAHPLAAPAAGASMTDPTQSASSGPAALLQILRLAHLASQLPAPQGAAAQQQQAAPAPPVGFAPPLQLPAQGVPAPGPLAGAAASGTSSDRLAPGADATAELEAAPSVAGLKVRRRRVCPHVRQRLAHHMPPSRALPPRQPPRPRPPAAARDVQRHPGRGLLGPAGRGELRRPQPARAPAAAPAAGAQPPHAPTGAAKIPDLWLPRPPAPPSCPGAQACHCPQCEQRVAAGHGRPLFSFTRFERHSGSKAKKWRLSIRIDPGAVKEAPIGEAGRGGGGGAGRGGGAPSKAGTVSVLYEWGAMHLTTPATDPPSTPTPAPPPTPAARPADEPPLALGQWLDSKGLVSWAPRGGLKIGPSGNGGGGGGSSGAPGLGWRRGLHGAAPRRRGPQACSSARLPCQAQQPTACRNRPNARR